MAEDLAARLVAGLGLEDDRRACSWCEDEVPLPAGELVGVCITCGTLVFRHDADDERAARHSAVRGYRDIPTPA